MNRSRSGAQGFSKAARIVCGVCGFCLPHAEIYRRFRLLEVQQTFYWPPRFQTVERWRAAAPEDFEFTVKAFQAITHPGGCPSYRKTKYDANERAQCGNFRDSAVVREAWQTTRKIADALRAHFVVFQCPPQFAASGTNIAQMRQFFDWAPRGRIRFTWEPRHKSWHADLVAELCKTFDLIHVVDPLEQTRVYGTPKYFRLHGKQRGGFRYDYNHPFTDEEMRTICDRCQPGPTYCMFNNMQMATDIEQFIKVCPVAQ